MAKLIYLTTRESRDALVLLQQAREYLECIPETAAGGDDEAQQLARAIAKYLGTIYAEQVPA